VEVIFEGGYEGKMLKEINIKNFAIVSDLTVDFQRGLNVITGETGAGKSIIVNAIELLVGGRASTDFVGAGAEEAHIVGIFDIDDRGILKEMDIPVDEYLIVRRVISRSGRSRVYLNDSPVTLNKLIDIFQSIVDIHGQHEHQGLLNTSAQRRILDEFGNLQELSDDVYQLFYRYKKLQEEIETIRARARDRAHRIDLLNFQIQEIDAAALNPEEKDELVEEHSILMNLSKLRELTEGSIHLLREGDRAVLDSLGEVSRNIEEISRYDSSSEEIKKLLKEAEALVEEAFYLLRDFREKYDIDPQRIDFVEKRLDLIERLERKYGEGIETILRYREEAAKELEELMGIEESLEGLEKEMKLVYEELNEKADMLSVKRKETAKIIEDRMKGLLRELAFQHPLFRVEIKDAELSSSGKDHVEFLFSANPGQPPRPLNRVASGGELSRVMLALKSIFTDVDMVPVVVFDEIDAGVGGKTADSVGRRIKDLSRGHQVICITHLPQIAARADHHINISKRTDKASTEVVVRTLDSKERIEELARMLSGSVTRASLKHAEELIKIKEQEVI